MPDPDRWRSGWWQRSRFFLPCALVVSASEPKVPPRRRALRLDQARVRRVAWILVRVALLHQQHLLFPHAPALGVAVASYMFGPAGIRYSEDPRYGIPATLGALWLTFILNLVGMRAGKWATYSAPAPSYLIAGLLVCFRPRNRLALRSGNPLSFVPEMNFDSLNFWSQIAFAFVGLEVAPILGGEIYDTRNVIPRAAWISGIGCGRILHGRYRGDAGCCSRPNKSARSPVSLRPGNWPAFGLERSGFLPPSRCSSSSACSGSSRRS